MPIVEFHNFPKLQSSVFMRGGGGGSEVARWLPIYLRNEVICQQGGDTLAVNNKRQLY